MFTTRRLRSAKVRSRPHARQPDALPPLLRLLNSPFAKTSLAGHRIDFAARLCWLLNGGESLATAGGTNNFCQNFTWFFHSHQFIETGEAIFISWSAPKPGQMILQSAPQIGRRVRNIKRAGPSPEEKTAVPIEQLTFWSFDQSARRFTIAASRNSAMKLGS